VINDLTEIKLYKTTTKGLKILGMCLPFVAIGLWVVTHEPTGTINYFMGWFCTCFFGLGIPVGLFHAFDRRPQIIISENGIWDRTTSQDEVKWEQIIEAYPLDIYDQKFISIVTDDTYVFRKKPYKWAAKISETIGAQNLNLQLGQLNIDANELANFINRLCEASIEERRKLIKPFKVKSSHFSFSDFQKMFVYVLISFLLVFFTLSSYIAFWIITGVMGIAVFTVRWRPDNSILRKYAATTIWFGFINMIMCFAAIKIYDAVTESVGEQLAIEIEEFRKHNGVFPTSIMPITEKLELNLFEHYFANSIEYRTTGNDYELEADMLFGKRRKFERNQMEWR
jgi:hypothetical protein